MKMVTHICNFVTTRGIKWEPFLRCTLFSRSITSHLSSRDVGSHNPQKAGFQQTSEETEVDFDQEYFEKNVETLIREKKKQQKAIKEKRMRNWIDGPGPPERKLTWEAMEQIRYMNQEYPDEWTLPHLAEGFGVTVDTVKRVLRSKFSAPLQRRVKQDSRVLVRNELKTKALGDFEKMKELKIPDPPVPLLVTPGNSIAVQVQPSLKTRPPQPFNKVYVKKFHKKNFQTFSDGDTNNVNLQSTEEMKLSKMQNTESHLNGYNKQGKAVSKETTAEHRVLGHEEKVDTIQKGREFYDSKGNFLYSI
ncbi:neugrin isoform X1 [Erpetoichthys calabaricus]|uniref:neugrin isoform X1 n=1 Tax=Erpetoichthys calabaricus TaxID=27687 RepID=UPI002234CE38|nr:neugrin isoform X1 [Erpetoichthys calabaricus]